MRSALFLSAIAPAALVAATAEAPPAAPQIYNLDYAGNGCSAPGSVKSTSTTLGDSASFTFSSLKGDDTSNCGIHLQAKGASEGWQVAIKEIEYKGTLSLKPGSSLDTYSQVFWSDNAAKTTTLSDNIVCTDVDFKDSFTLRQKTSTLNWSKCTGADGNPGILNVNFRPVVQGKAGSYDVKSATWQLVWRKC
ncbi:uncharacterized protein EI97DRAFT_374387 [Westerdykella ornata]|uniref:Secreted protein n=1 Tax=Westerdykella ornata TaxID=318751 RepID=A0A6A6JN23_WESOR|nr:uncharacterized protein EI97DRAFT_374387 [Westerdykella ornata]KAF2278001.1 hypothetical protein EI97DRAFT_374387 [Westerdykella ornata]